MKKILYYNENTFLSSFPFFSNYIGIYEENDENVKNIVLNNIFVIEYRMFKGKILFSNYKYLNKMFKINDYKYSNEKYKCLEYIKNQINKNNYVVSVLKFNNFIINNKIAIDCTHTWLIYGYDDSENELYLSGYLENNGLFKNTKFKIKYKMFYESIPNSKESKLYENNIMNNHIYGKYPDTILLNTDQIQKNLKRQIMFNPLKPNKGFTAILFLILDYNIKFFLKLNKKHNIIEIKTMKTICEHFYLLNDICKKYNLNTDILEKSKKVLNQANKLLLYVIKCRKINYCELKYKEFIVLRKGLLGIMKEEYLLIKHIIFNKLI